MAILHLHAAWLGIFLGFLAGGVLGLSFHKEQWLGGYGSWPRRMSRLGHISFFGLAFINLAYAVSLPQFPEVDLPRYTSHLFLAGTVTMPLVCFLAAWEKKFRHLFFLPVSCLVTGAILTLKGVLL